MHNMERGPNFQVAELTKDILSTTSHFPSSTTEMIRFLYTYVIFQTMHAWSPIISAQPPARPHIPLWIQFSQEFLPSPCSKSGLPRAIILWNGLPADLQSLTTSKWTQKYLKLTWVYLFFLWKTFLVLVYPYCDTFLFSYTTRTPPPPPTHTGM